MTNQCHGRYVESFGRLHLAQSLHNPGYVCAELRDIRIKRYALAA
jgi:hypothetical protein